jgi:hypothetical protein
MSEQDNFELAFNMYCLQVTSGVLYYSKLSYLTDFFHNLKLCQLYEKGLELSSSLAQRKLSS